MTSRITIPQSRPKVTNINAYVMSYTIGYYYGRAFCGLDADIDAAYARVAEQDRWHMENDGFAVGVRDGQRDFQDVDLTNAALAEPIVDPL